jgi:hypothetical protein
MILIFPIWHVMMMIMTMIIIIIIIIDFITCVMILLGQGEIVRRALCQTLLKLLPTYT